MKITARAITIVAIMLLISSNSFADGVIRGTVKRLNGVGAGDTTAKVEVSIAPESISALPDGAGNCLQGPKDNQGIVVYLMPTNPSFKSILPILLTAGATKKIAGVDTQTNGCFIKNGYIEY